ncbi:MAG: sigma-E factor negative regulatory protein RseC [Motiliproteus sp.]|jgi:sigma-E factor negative regulatory protein RseC
MLTEQAQVIALEPGGVRVETIRNSGCSSCQAKAGCGQKLLAEIGQGQRFQILSGNPQQLLLAPGDMVELGVDEGSFLQASAMLYLLPLLGLILSSALADALGMVEAIVVLAGISGLLLGFVAVRCWSSRDRQQYRYQPQILRLKKL